MILLDMYAATDPGRRTINQDRVITAPDHGFALLADGMGGHKAGEVASDMAVELISDELKQRLLATPAGAIDPASGLSGQSILIRNSIRHANDMIYQASLSRQAYAGMGTTILAAVFYADRLCAAHAGDSRMYRLRDHILTHVTRDHSLIQEQVRRGLLSPAEARKARIKNLVTRALGVKLGMAPDLVEEIVRPDDLYLLCSDGLTDVISDEIIHQTLQKHGADLQQAVDRLIQLANEAGGPDNISVIIINTRTRPKRSLLNRLLGRK